MRFVTLREVLELHPRVLEQSHGLFGIRDLGGLQSALAQPRMTFDGEDLYPTLIEKASALGFSIIQNHPFIDGNKRTAHAAMEIFLILNGSARGNCSESGFRRNESGRVHHMASQSCR